MAFTFTAFGQSLASDPKAAHARLVEMFNRHNCSTSAVAADLNVNVVTLRRWVKKLVDLGFSDPGRGSRQVRGADKAKRAAGKQKRPAVR